MLLLDILLVFIGAGLGGVSRFASAEGLAYLLGRNFPYGTLTVNCVGSLLVGILFTILLERGDATASQLRALILTGYCGGFTTFSSFSLETLNLFENGAYIAAAANVILNVVLCLTMVTIGVLGARQL